MEVIKDIAAVVGCVLSCLSLLMLIIKPIRKKVANFISDVSNKTETVNKAHFCCTVSYLNGGLRKSLHHEECWPKSVSA